MAKFTSETIIIKKEAWFFLQNWERTRWGFKPLPTGWLEKRFWENPFRNRGANPATHPINRNEIRLDKESYLVPIDRIKDVLTANGYEYREDGFIVEGINI